MAGTWNSRLEELKEGVRQASNEQYRVKQAKQELAVKHEQNQEKLSRQELAMSDFIKNVFQKSEIANQQEKAMFHEQLNQFSYNQQDMKKQIIKLNDYLTDTTALDDVYQLKKAQLDEQYIEIQNRWDSKIENQKKEIREQEEKIKKNETRIEEQEKEIKEKEMSIKFLKSKAWTMFWLAIVGGIDYFTGYWIVGTVWTLLKALFHAFIGLF